jgi:transposase InsO family protein
MKGKQHHEVIKKGPMPQAEKPMQVIHTNLCSPMPVKSYQHHHYFVSFIDDHTQHAWVYFICDKSKTILWFHDFLAATVHFSDMWVLQLDHGGEYIGNNFQQLLQEHGITHSLAPAYTLQYNGIAEQFNCTILDMTRSMLHNAGASKWLWAEAVNMSIYITNQLPCEHHPTAPYEALTGWWLHLCHLHVFGCKAHLLTPSSLCNKLQNWSTDVIYISLAQTGKHHWLWCASLRWVSES